MSTQPKKLPVPYTLELSLDVNQLTQSLQHNLYRNYNSKKPELCPMVTTGAVAGTYNFKQGDEIELVVKATVEGKQKPKLELNVTNCTLVFIQPAVDQPLSLFDQHNACIPISEWSLPQDVPSAQKNQTCVKVSTLGYLPVTAETGLWKISGYLSILFRIGGNSVSRLYYFDPEGSAGDGTGFGND